MLIAAEIGANHRGNLDTAKQMIHIAAEYCGVDIVKFQKRNNRELLTPEEYDRPHPVQEQSYGITYGEHREKLEFTIEQHKELKAECESVNVEYSCSVWDVTSTKEIISLNPRFIKVPSACNSNFNILEIICDTFKGEIHLSLGMTTDKEEKDIVDFIRSKKRLKDLVLYFCVSDYPVAVNNICLKQILKLKEKYESEIKGFGFSGHHEGYYIDNICIALGVKYIERHFTFNNNWKGTDHMASLEPDAFKAMIKIIKDTQRAYRYKDKEILDCELRQRDKLKRL